MRFQGIVYRAHDPRWSWSPLSGEGARRNGGRFNRKGAPALYTALSQMTAIREAQALGQPMQPLTLCAYAVDAEPVFDALDVAQWPAHSVTQGELVCPAWRRVMLEGVTPASQALADRLIAAGYVGLRVQSFARGAGPDDINLVFWQWADKRPSRVVLIDDEGRLPKGPTEK